MEGKGQAAYSEGITDTISSASVYLGQWCPSMRLLAYFVLLAEGRLQEVGGRGKQVEMRVQRRVRMGKKDEVGSPYILSPS